MGSGDAARVFVCVCVCMCVLVCSCIDGDASDSCFGCLGISQDSADMLRSRSPKLMGGPNYNHFKV